MRDDKRIKIVKLKNFKGFYGELEIDLKGKNSVISGENGSGKSCVVEALKLLFDSSKEFVNTGINKTIYRSKFGREDRIDDESKRLISDKIFLEESDCILLPDDALEKLSNLVIDGKISQEIKDYFEVCSQV